MDIAQEIKVALANLSKVTLEQVLDSYPEVTKPIFLNTVVANNRPYGALVHRSVYPEPGHSITIRVPYEMAFEENVVAIFQGIYAHELAHIANKDFDFPHITRLIAAHCVAKLGKPMFPLARMLFRNSETRADLEAIKRGYGEQLVQSVRYFQDHSGTARHGSMYMTLPDLEAMVGKPTALSS